MTKSKAIELIRYIQHIQNVMLKIRINMRSIYVQRLYINCINMNFRFIYLEQASVSEDDADKIVFNTFLVESKLNSGIAVGSATPTVKIFI